jgi:hypothetical protein
MSLDTIGDLNWLAVVVSTVIYFLLGGLWYSPVFLGRPWMRATGMEMPAEGEGPGAAIYVAPLIAYFVSAIATGMLAEATGSSTIGEGLLLGGVVAVGYSIMLAGVTATFSPKMPAPWTWFWIRASYNLLGLLIVGAFVAAWG